MLSDAPRANKRIATARNALAPSETVKHRIAPSANAANKLDRIARTDAKHRSESSALTRAIEMNLLAIDRKADPVPNDPRRHAPSGARHVVQNARNARNAQDRKAIPMSAAANEGIDGRTAA
jgi:hypothetical protein